MYSQLKQVSVFSTLIDLSYPQTHRGYSQAVGSLQLGRRLGDSHKWKVVCPDVY